jgi:hypothetical protein
MIGVEIALQCFDVSYEPGIKKRGTECYDCFRRDVRF